MENQQEEVQVEKKSKKAAKEALASQASAGSPEAAEGKATSVKITFEGEAAKRILKCELELRERLSKPDLGKILGAEILTWSEKRWSEIIEENTDIEFFFAQIRKCPDKSKSIKMLKAMSEKLRSEIPDGSFQSGASHSTGLSVAHDDGVQLQSAQES